MTLTFFKDLKQKELIPIKILLFLQAAGDMALYPFLTLHMKYLGISVSDIGVQFAVSPVATLIATPLVGLLADKIGNFKIMLSVSLVLCAMVSQLFLLVPAVVTVTLQAEPTGLSCDPTDGKILPTAEQAKTQAMFSDCTTTCGNQNQTFELCFERASKKLCTSSNITFELKVGNESSTYEYFYQNNVYDTITCSFLNNQSMCGATCFYSNNTTIQDKSSKAVTFWGYLIIRVGLFVIIATEMSLLKAAILTILERFDSDYGFQRLWASIAICIVPPVTGIIMDKMKHGNEEDYRPCFYIYGGMKILMAIIALIVKMDVKPPTLHVWKNLGKLLRNIEVDTLLFYCTFIGSCWGFLETFFLWFMEALGASKSLMGLTFTVGAVSSIPITLVAGALARRFGHVPLIVLGMIVYCGRFVGYSFVQTPYEALGLEALECITMGLMMITLTTYANMLAGKELVATMQATWAALHFSVGRALGSVIGGFLIENFGTRATYRIFSVASIVMGFIYLFADRVWFAKNHQADEPKVEKEKTATGKKASLSLTDILTEEKMALDKQSNDDLQKCPLKTQKNSGGKENLGYESTNL